MNISNQTFSFALFQNFKKLPLQVSDTVLHNRSPTALSDTVLLHLTVLIAVRDGIRRRHQNPPLGWKFPELPRHDRYSKQGRGHSGNKRNSTSWSKSSIPQNRGTRKHPLSAKMMWVVCLDVEKFYFQLTLWARSLRNNLVIAETQHLVTVVTCSINTVGGGECERISLTFCSASSSWQWRSTHCWCLRHLLHRTISHGLCNAEVSGVTANCCFRRFPKIFYTNEAAKFKVWCWFWRINCSGRIQIP